MPPFLLFFPQSFSSAKVQNTGSLKDNWNGLVSLCISASEGRWGGGRWLLSSSLHLCCSASEKLNTVLFLLYYRYHLQYNRQFFHSAKEFRLQICMQACSATELVCTYHFLNHEMDLDWFGSSVADPDPGSGAFLTPGSGIWNRFFPDPGSQIHIFGSILKIFWVKTSTILWKLAQIFFFTISKIT